METSGHIVRDIDRGFQACSYHSCDPFLRVTGKLCGFIVSVRARRRIKDSREDERVVGYAEADGAYGAKDS